jgi:hypothetical protein
MQGSGIPFLPRFERHGIRFIETDMVTRLTAWLLSFCIGLPMCWCCMGEAPREEQAGCCTTEHPDGCAARQPDGSGTSDEEPCACCATRKDPRDAARGLNFTPQPESRPMMHLAGWQDSLPAPAHCGADDADAGHYERGPPGEPARLFLRHRALLL